MHRLHEHPPLHAWWPPLSLAWRYVARGAVLWMVLRGSTAALSRPYRSSSSHVPVEPFDPAFASALIITIITATVIALDAHRRRELHFLANLGVGARAVILLAVLPAILLELLRLLTVARWS